MSIGSKLGKIQRFIANPSFYRNFFHNNFQFGKLTEPPIIICGCPRSGTTLLMSLLDSHSEIHVIPFETAVLQKRELKKRIFKNARLNSAFIRWQLKSYLMSTKIKITARRWCEKTPLNVLNTDEIRTVFNGRVQFINIIRDGRDVVSSFHEGLGYMVKPELWLRCIVAAEGNFDRDDFLSVKYEDLVEKPTETLNRISEFLKLSSPFSSDKWHLSSIDTNINSVVNGKDLFFKKSKISTNSIGKWRTSESPWVNEFIRNQEYITKNEALGYK
jgi:hypothetical protein